MYTYLVNYKFCFMLVVYYIDIKEYNEFRKYFKRFTRIRRR